MDGWRTATVGEAGSKTRTLTDSLDCPRRDPVGSDPAGSGNVEPNAYASNNHSHSYKHRTDCWTSQFEAYRRFLGLLGFDATGALLEMESASTACSTSQALIATTPQALIAALLLMVASTACTTSQALIATTPQALIAALLLVVFASPCTSHARCPHVCPHSVAVFASPPSALVVAAL